MRALYVLLLLAVCTIAGAQPPAQRSPCVTDPLYRQFDFWIGAWEVYAKNGRKAGDSRIEFILDSCVLLESWTSANGGYAGKSFNTYNAVSGQWQQTWVDNRGGSTEFLEGKYENDRMVFRTRPYAHTKDTMAIRRLTFYHLAPDKVRQHGEISKDSARSWSTEYDLEYRRSKR